MTPHPAPSTPVETVDHFQRIPYAPAADGRIEMHSGLSRHYPTLHANLVEAPGASRRRGVVMCHPASNFLSHFLLGALARAGQPAMGLNTRYANNEPALLMERAAADLGTGIRWMREELGFDEVVLLGFSGGGSLATFHQSRATGPGRHAEDAVMRWSARTGRARRCRGTGIDASVTDEDDPWSVDPDLDLYAPGRDAPLDRDWVERYREAQLARMRRIDARALEALERLEREGGSDRGFVVHRTTADPRFVDVTLDPSDREVGLMYGDPGPPTPRPGPGPLRHRPQLAQHREPDHTAADALTDLPRITAPTLVMSLLGDQAAFAEDSRPHGRRARPTRTSSCSRCDISTTTSWTSRTAWPPSWASSWTGWTAASTPVPPPSPHRKDSHDHGLRDAPAAPPLPGGALPHGLRLPGGPREPALPAGPLARARADRDRPAAHRRAGRRRVRGLFAGRPGGRALLSTRSTTASSARPPRGGSVDRALADGHRLIEDAPESMRE